MISCAFHILKLNLLAAAVITTGIFLSRLVRKSYSVRWKYWLWLAIAVLLLIPVDLSAVSPVRVAVSPPQYGRSAGERSAVRLPGEQENGQDEAVRLPGEQENSQNEAVLLSGKQGAAAAEEVRREARLHQKTVVLSSRTVSLYGILELFAWFWPIGVVVLGLVRILRYRFSMRMLRRWSVPVSDEETRKLYRRVCRDLHVTRIPPLFVNARILTPVLAGLHSPGLYLTEESYEPEELEFIFRHELTHRKRRDLWYKLLLQAVTTIYWFNPALYWMKSEAEKDIENLCDRAVVASSAKEERMRYSRLLLRTAAFQNHIPYLAASLNDSTLVFKERIAYMSRVGTLREKMLPFVVLGAVLVAGNAAVGCYVDADEPSSGYGAENGWHSAVSWSEGADGDGTGVQGQRIVRDGAVLAGYDGRSMQTETQMLRNPSESAADWSGNETMQRPFGQTYMSETDAAADRPVQTEDTGIQNEQSESGENGTPDQQSGLEELPEAGQEQSPGEPEDTGLQENQLWNSDGQLATQDPDSVFSVWSISDPYAAYVYRYSDGRWYNGFQKEYVPIGNGQWKRVEDGSIWQDTPIQQAPENAQESVYVRDESGYNTNVLYQNEENGVWINIAGGIYTPNGDGTYTGPDGTLWYPSNPQ